MTLEATEAECAAGRTAPRVSLSDIKDAIASVYFVNGWDAAQAGKAEPGLDGLRFGFPHNPLKPLTICLVVMKNGFTVIGKSAPASPDNFDADLGKKLAYEDAVRQIWPLMGFSLRDRLASVTGP